MTGRPAVGLRRFVAGAPGSAPSTPPGPPPEPEPERCELCGTVVAERHGHLVDVEAHSLVCACRACYLLFTHDSAGNRYRAVPDSVAYDPERPIGVADWEELQIPVAAAFFLSTTGQEGVAAFYPSPAGATECLLDLDAWDRLVAGQPMLAAARPDVEAVLIRRVADELECYLVPVDVCYELVGTVKVHWRGFDGGTEARQRIDEFFATVRARARPFDAGATR
jgi:hypothetical protein